MGTRSRIGVMHGDNCKSVYCHWDGYLEHNGRILLENYDSAKANNLVALGDLSSLGPDIGEKHTFDSPFNYGTPEYDTWMSEKSKVCTFYGRDREEQDTGYKTDDTFEQFLQRADGCGAEYYYIMKDDVWYVGTTYSSDYTLGGKLVPLAEALEEVAVDR